jgi:hypothetical protein
MRSLYGVLAISLAMGVFAAESTSPQKLTVGQIVEKNVAARGGLEAWRGVQTLVWIGHLQSEHAPLPSMGFILEQKRPNKTRFQLIGMNEKAVRVFDGTQGWKLGPTRNGQSDVRPYTLEDLRFAQSGPGLDGPLIDYATKGSTVALEGVEVVRGHEAYRLSVHLSSGETDHVWIDAKTFLDLRYDRPSSGSLPESRPVSVFYGDYRNVDGVQIPSVLETGANLGSHPDKMTIDRIVVNSPLEDTTFTKAGTSDTRSGVRQRTGRRPPPPSPELAAK